jgi:hypothetical protein
MKKQNSINRAARRAHYRALLAALVRGGTLA